MIDSPTTLVRVNIAAMRQPFHPCTPTFIADVCQARCCRSTTDPTGIAVVVTPTEAVALRRRGATVHDNGRVEPVARRCPFQGTTDHLCTLHGTGDKPAGCTISPFTINATHTLIVRNRYRMLPCFKADGALPVAVAHQHSLALIFGEDIAAGIAVLASLEESHTTTVRLPVADDIIAMLAHKNTTSKPCPPPAA